MRLAVITLVAAMAFIRAHAALEWEHATLDLDAGPLDEKIDAVFRFTNTGAAPVTIAQTHASCGCTVPTLDKQTFAPGEKGELRVVYTIGEGTTGRQEKTITVLTNETPDESYLLTLRVQIPGLWEVHPKFVKWEHDEEPAAKTVTIRALHPELARPVGVASRDPRFTTELRASPDEPGVFVVSITPGSTAAPMFTSVTVETDTPADKKRVVQLYAVVR